MGPGDPEALVSAANSALPAHHKEMARRFLAGLDPEATRFTFQFFRDSPGAGRYAEIFHGTLDEVWPKVLALNTPQHSVGVFVTINETDFGGRSAENIVRSRALFADADGKEQVTSCTTALKSRGVCPSMVVNSGRGAHVYFCTDVPLNQHAPLQKSLAAKLETDSAVNDLPRVMRLPGTLHLKDPANPRLVKLVVPGDEPVQRWRLPDLISKLGLSPSPMTPEGNVVPFKAREGWPIEGQPAAIFAELPTPIERLTEGLDTNTEEIRSAVMAIPPSVIADEGNWMRLARGLAYEARIFKKQKEMWEILDVASRRADNYDEEDNRLRFQRYMSEAVDREDPISIRSVFHMAAEHGWREWSPPIAPTASPADLKVSFANIPHRRWLYGVDLVRGDITLIGSPGGAGKTSLAIGMAVAIGTGRRLLEEKIFGGEGLKVLYINAEDSSVEMKRRIFAFSRKHNVAEQDLARLYVAGTEDPRVQRLSFLRTVEKNSAIDQEGFKQLEELLAALQPDLVVLDPLVALCGGGNINDNSAMSLVMRDIKRLAIKHDCAVLIIHHTKKGGDLTNAEAISGASAIVNLARHAIMTVTMTQEEAKKVGVLPSERYRYFKAVDAKSNLAPRSGDSPWYELCSEELPNAEPPIYPHGDRVQAVVRVNLAVLGSAPAAEDPQIRRAILDVVQRGKTIDGQSYPHSPSPAGASNKRPLLEDAMNAVATATLPRIWQSDDLKAITERTITDMKSDGWLVEYVIPDNVKRFRGGRALRADWTKTPWPDEADGGADGSSS
jgi:hypothetical protein